VSVRGLHAGRTGAVFEGPASKWKSIKLEAPLAVQARARAGFFPLNKFAEVEPRFDRRREARERVNDREHPQLASGRKPILENRKPRSVDGRSNRHSGVRSHPATEARGGNAAGSEIHTTAETRSSALRTNPSRQCRRHGCIERSSSPATAAACSLPCILP